MPPSRKRSRTTEYSEPTGQSGKVSKRSCNACSRCRRQKIKCSGTHPCEACKKRRLSCDFDSRDQKILVTKRYILELQDKIAQLEGLQEGDNTVLCATPSLNNASPVARRIEADSTERSFGRSGMEEDSMAFESGRHDGVEESGAPPAMLDPVASSLINPLSSARAFMFTDDGRTYHLGTSSNWSFTRRVLIMTHNYIHGRSVPTSSLLFDAAAYDIGWNGSRKALGPDAPILPSLEHAIYLINAVKFHCGLFFHLFHEETLMAKLYDFYADPQEGAETADMWYIQLLIILAFGKAFVGKRTDDKRPHGAELFIRAFQLLPDLDNLWKEPIPAIETLVCISLYLQCLDYRHSAHNYIGQAMRMALSQGMHADMPVQHLGEITVERCRRIWWTIYVLDREMTSLMGLPQSIQDDDICPQFPNFSGSKQRVAALEMQVKFSQTIATINRGVYGADGRMHRRFLTSTKTVLESIANLAEELQRSFPIHTDKSLTGISRTSAYLHLLHHQCIALTTRPLLFCFLKIRIESQGSYFDTLTSSKTVWNLLKMCIESSQQMINILNSLQSQGLLETFLPFDLESLFVSTVNLVLGPALHPHLLENRASWIFKAYGVFDEMIAAGNRVAEFRKSELQQLEDLLARLPSRDSQPLSPPVPPGPTRDLDTELLSNSSLVMPAHHIQNELLPSPISGVFGGMQFDTGLTATQIMDMANSIDAADTDWMSHTMMEHSIW